MSEKLYTTSKDHAALMNQWAEDIAGREQSLENILANVHCMLSGIEAFAEDTADTYEERDAENFFEEDEEDFRLSSFGKRFAEDANDMVDCYLEFLSKFNNLNKKYDVRSIKFTNSEDFDKWHDLKHINDGERA